MRRIKPKQIPPKKIVPSSHVKRGKPYLQYGLGVSSGIVLALLYLTFAIWLISSLIFSNQEPPPAASLPAFAQEEAFAARTLDLPRSDDFAEDTEAVELMEAYLGDELHSADLNSDGLLIVNIRTGIDPVSLTAEQADTVHGSYLDETSRKDYYARMGSILYLVFHHQGAADVNAVRIQLAVPATDPDGKELTVYDLAQGNLDRMLADQIDWRHITVDEFTRLIHQNR
jgi:hypothetical protein